MPSHYPYSGIIPNVRIWKQKSKLDDDDKEWILANVHYLNLREIAEYVDCSVTTVYRFLESKGIHRKTKRAVWK